MDICFITDSNYLLATMVAVKSLIMNNQGENLCIHVVCNNLSDTERHQIQKLKTQKFDIDIINVTNNFINIPEHHPYVSKTALLKFCLPDIFKNTDKLLYFDDDILILNNIKNLYDTDIDKVYAAVVEDMIAVETGLAKKINLKRYFNSGVMLLNLKKMREDNIPQQLTECKRNDELNSFMDQNTFNKVFNGNVIFLSPTFNLMTTVKNKYTIEEMAKFYKISEKEFDYLCKFPVILHMTGGLKPWKDILCDNFIINLPYLFKLPNSKLRNDAIRNLYKQNPKRFIKYFILKVLKLGAIIGK